MDVSTDPSPISPPTSSEAMVDVGSPTRETPLVTRKEGVALNDPNGIPRIALPKKLLQQIRQPWTNTLIVRLLGKSIRVDHRKEICRYKAVNPFLQISQRTTMASDGDGLAVSETLQMTPIQPNGNLQTLEQRADNFGPWILVTKKTRRPLPNRKAQTHGPNSNSNKFVELGISTHQVEEANRNPQTNSLGRDKEAPSSSGPLIHIGPVATSTTSQPILDKAQKPHHTALGSTNTPNNIASLAQSQPPINAPLSPKLPKALITSQVELTSMLSYGNPSLQVSTRKSLEIPMTEVLADITHHSIPNLTPLNQSISFREGKSRARKPPDPNSRHGEYKNGPSNGLYSQNGGQCNRVVVRARDRSHSPCRLTVSHLNGKDLPVETTPQ
ncbi:unnamed protein product [Camellia sinensis]